MVSHFHSRVEQYEHITIRTDLSDLGRWLVCFVKGLYFFWINLVIFIVTAVVELEQIICRGFVIRDWNFHILDSFFWLKFEQLKGSQVTLVVQNWAYSCHTDWNNISIVIKRFRNLIRPKSLVLLAFTLLDNNFLRQIADKRCIIELGHLYCKVEMCERSYIFILLERYYREVTLNVFFVRKNWKFQFPRIKI